MTRLVVCSTCINAAAAGLAHPVSFAPMWLNVVMSISIAVYGIMFACKARVEWS